MTLSEAADRLARAAIGMQKTQEIDRIAAAHRPRLSAFFRRQKSLTLDQFSNYKFLFTESYRTFAEKATPNEFFTASDFNQLWSKIDTETFDDLQKTITGVQSEGVLKGGQQLLDSMTGHFEGGKWVEGVPKFWDLSNPRAVAWFQQHGGSLSYIKNIQETTRNELQTIIAQSIDGGWSYNQTAKAISDKFDDFGRDRARRIAIHETTQAYEAGNNEFAQGRKDDGIQMEKHWNTSKDEKVCDTCNQNEADGWIPLDQLHSSGHQYPPAHNGDRCFETYRQAQTS